MEAVSNCTPPVSPGAAGEIGWRLLGGDGKYLAVGYGHGQLFVDRANSGVTGFSKGSIRRAPRPRSHWAIRPWS